MVVLTFQVVVYLTYSIRFAIVNSMNKRDIVIGLVIVAMLVGVVYFRRQNESEELVIPQTLSVEDEIEESFNIDIPEDVDKAELSDVGGGDATAIATRKFENGKYEHNILADLPEIETSEFYQGWLVKGEEGSDGYSVLSTGKLRIAKGGWMLNFESSNDYSDYGKVIVSREKVNDTTPETHILEGSF